MKKIIVGIFLILLAGLVLISNNGEKLLLKAESYGVKYNVGRVFDPIERHELKQLVEQTSVENYNQATDLINEMIANGYNEADIPLVLYSGVTASELDLITELHDNFMAYLQKDEIQAPKEEAEENIEETTDNDSDDDGVSDEFDICDGGNDLIDDNYNLIPDDCEYIESEEPVPADVTSDDYSDSDTSSVPEEPVNTPEEPVNTPEDGGEIGEIENPDEPTNLPEEPIENPGDGETDDPTIDQHFN